MSLPRKNQDPTTQVSSEIMPEIEARDIRSEYAILKELGVGGMAKILLAKNKDPFHKGPPVAVKALLSLFQQDTEVKQLFAYEAQLSLQLRHPNIVACYEFAQYGPDLCLVLEYIEGKTLTQLKNELKIRGKSIPVDLVHYIAVEAAKGLSYVHNKTDDRTGEPMGLIHRDISSRNIMVSVGGDVKILDFGIAKFDDRLPLTRTGVFRGTPKYCSPEQRQGKKVDLRTDIYSLGVVIQDCLESEGGNENHTAFGKILHLFSHDRRYNELLRISRKCTGLAPQDRYASVAELLVDLERVHELTPTGYDPKLALAALLGELLPKLVLETPKTRRYEDGTTRHISQRMKLRQTSGPSGLTVSFLGFCLLVLGAAGAYSYFGHGKAPTIEIEKLSQMSSVAIDRLTDHSEAVLSVSRQVIADSAEFLEQEANKVKNLPPSPKPSELRKKSGMK